MCGETCIHIFTVSTYTFVYFRTLDGLYVFCDLAKCPEHLRALARPHLASTTDFRWNVSGPRESATKAFVMRGCHGLPKTSGKSRDKCGVVYTKVNDYMMLCPFIALWNSSHPCFLQIVNGQEDFQYRLLHIYPNMLSTLSRPRPVKKKQAQPVQQIQVAGCEVCGKDSHGDCLLECDGCKRQYCHTYCLGLTAVPQGEWYCSKYSSVKQTKQVSTWFSCSSLPIFLFITKRAACRESR